MPKRHLFAKMDGRWLTFGLVAAFFLLLKAASMTLDRPVFELPPFAWFGPMPPYFADLRGVVAWTEERRAGIPPGSAQFRDPWNRPANYPWWWLYSDYVGLNGKTVMGFGYGMGALFLVSCFFVVGRLDAFGGLTAGLFLISYAVMFGLERANVDLLMFVLLALALALRQIPILAAVIIAVAAVLKLYPVFAFLALLIPSGKKTLTSVGAGLLIFALGILDHFQDFIKAMGTAPNMRSGVLSFGMASLGLMFMERFNRPDLYTEVLVSGAALFILAVGWGAWNRPRFDPELFDQRDLFAFRMGAGIYLGSFLLGTNHDYRAVFLLFCLPLLLRLLKQGVSLKWVRTTLLLILIYVNWLYLRGESKWSDYLLNQATAWALVVCLTGLSVANLPAAWQWPSPKRDAG